MVLHNAVKTAKTFTEGGEKSTGCQFATVADDHCAAEMWSNADKRGCLCAAGNIVG